MTIPDYLEHYETAPFDGDEARELLEQAHLVAELTRHPGWAVLSERIEREANARESRVMNGGCADHIDYVKQINYVRGLRHILEAPEALRKAAERARPEREEEQ